MTQVGTQNPLTQPPDLSGAAGYQWGGMTVPRNIWDAVRNASAATNVSVPGVQGSSRGQVPPALLLALTEYENPTYFTASPDPKSRVPDSDPKTSYNGVYDVWGPLQLGTFGVGHGWTREQLSDINTNYSIGAQAIQNNAKGILAKNPTIDNNTLWAQAVGGDNWTDVKQANPWQSAYLAIPTYERYPTLTGSAGTDSALPLPTPTTPPQGQADTGPLAGVGDAINRFTSSITGSFTTFQQDLQLWGFKALVGIAGVFFIVVGLWQLPRFQQAARSAGSALKRDTVGGAATV